ncbi:unknown [Bacteroides sp. CAG:462]|nr:unknown [Bacteroides sp. CAG:462]
MTTHPESFVRKHPALIRNDKQTAVPYRKMILPSLQTKIRSS